MGPSFQRCCDNMKAVASIPLVMSFAGLDAVVQYLHACCEVVSRTCCTRCRMNCCCRCFHDDIHANTIFESLHNIIWCVLVLDSMDFARYWDSSAPSSAASSSNLGIVCGFTGATLLVDIRKVHDISPSGVAALKYATAPYDSLLLSQNTWSWILLTLSLKCDRSISSGLRCYLAILSSFLCEFQGVLRPMLCCVSIILAS